MARTGAAWILVALLAVCVVTARQSKPSFEVASVKPQSEPLTIGNISSAAFPRALPGGRFSGTHVTVESLLTFAYDLRAYRIVDGPEWVRRDLFAVTARAESDATADQIKLMLQSLLEDRFKLVTHMEPREIRVQALVRVRPDGSLGPGIFRMDDQCSPAVVNELRLKFPEKYPTPLGNGMMSGCSHSGVNILADYLTMRLGVPVVDATGLEGHFYHSLRAHLPPVTSRLGAAKSDPDPDLPALSTALEEQLGLKLESRRGPVEVLVIDSVQQPTEN